MNPKATEFVPLPPSESTSESLCVSSSTAKMNPLADSFKPSSSIDEGNSHYGDIKGDENAYRSSNNDFDNLNWTPQEVRSNIDFFDMFSTQSPVP